MTGPIVDFWYSLRSPYSWLAVHRLTRLPSLPMELRLLPTFPQPGGPEPAVTADPRRFRYMIQDVTRISSAYGLAVSWPPRVDCDWARPHAGALFADEQGRGLPYLREAFRARFERSEDLEEDAVLRAVAERSKLDPDALLAACDDPALRERTTASRERHAQLGLVGVPSFVVDERIYWGNDRLEWLLRDVCFQGGRPVPSLEDDVFGLPCPEPDGAVTD